jgi:hypothetical protein
VQTRPRFGIGKRVCPERPGPAANGVVIAPYGDIAIELAARSTPTHLYRRHWSRPILLAISRAAKIGSSAIAKVNGRNASTASCKVGTPPTRRPSSAISRCVRPGAFESTSLQRRVAQTSFESNRRLTEYYRPLCRSRCCCQVVLAKQSAWRGLPIRQSHRPRALALTVGCWPSNSGFARRSPLARDSWRPYRQLVPKGCE